MWGIGFWRFGGKGLRWIVVGESVVVGGIGGRFCIVVCCFVVLEGGLGDWDFVGLYCFF